MEELEDGDYIIPNAPRLHIVSVHLPARGTDTGGRAAAASGLKPPKPLPVLCFITSPSWSDLHTRRGELCFKAAPTLLTLVVVSSRPGCGGLFGISASGTLGV